MSSPMFGKFLFGVVAGYLLAQFTKDGDLGNLIERFTGGGEEGKASAGERPVAAEADSADPAAAAMTEDLTLIEGIGPKIREILHGEGIATFAHLADATVPELKEILERAGGRYRQHDPKTWPKQAALAAAGEREALDRLKKELKRGKRG